MDLVLSPDSFFANAKGRFNEYLQGGFFEQRPRSGFYLHRIVAKSRSYTGLVADFDIRDYLEGQVKRHENTIASVEQEQIRQALLRNAQTKPVMLAYRNAPAVDALLEEYSAAQPPFMEAWFEEADERHRFWEITEEAHIQKIQALFLDQVPMAYIADGHHRSAAAASLYQRFGAEKPDNPYRWLTCALYPLSELEIHDFNRIHYGLNELRPALFMVKLSRLFDIEPLGRAQKPTRKHELTLLLDLQWYQLRWKPGVLAEFVEDPFLLDVNLLNKLVFSDLLGVADVRTDPRLKYMEGPKGIAALRDKARRNEEHLAFYLYPVSMEDFLAISDSHGVLPPKSTWFEPRLRNGLVVKQYLD